ncbi:hypothetical protein [Stenotrophomonas maltophilia]|uniref:hypothetical protein n=1 Tax=Stenotrophomonas maltophilia TaxID=40324 RepID=UPI0039C1D67C
MATEKTIAEVLQLAAEIADRTVRSDIELFAKDVYVDGVQHYDLDAPRLYDEDVSMVRDALEYIDLRGEGVFPWIMHRHPQQPNLVRFEDRVVGK